MYLCNRKSARTKTTVAVNLISLWQQCRNSLHKVVVKAACLLQRCLNLLYVYMGGGAGPAGQVLAGPLFCLINYS